MTNHAVLAEKKAEAAAAAAAAKKAAAEKAVRALFTGALLGKSLYRAAILNAIFETGTVQNVKLLQPETDIDGTERTLCRLGEVTITEAEA